MEIVSVEKKKDCFEVVAHGVSGFRTYYAKNIIDTRVHTEMVASKTLNILVNSETNATLHVPSGVKAKAWGYENDIVLACLVDKNASYIDARRVITKVMQILPEDYKTVMVADVFDYELHKEYPGEKDGIIYMPSCAYENPLIAFDAGVLYVKGGEKL